ncbi:hypothetical protein MSAN_01596000 [Mycena sanguinolenta]|uniref:Uncharacterized protein n=1 Tax=Mycena sanguinolenta TaxID=230812 RepID=A0A8H6Y4A2_9AGAR|nr:hypothetical protein MSAN_01596000 [Mycena sanguinolenta]
MCFEDNSAPLSVRYLNAQLSAMWKNAVECVGYTGTKTTTVDLRSSDYQKHKYTRSLAEFHFAGLAPTRGSIAVENLFFNGVFGQPRLEFICNHEAVLYLTLLEGHFNKIYPTKTAVRGYKSNTTDNVLLDGIEVAFRVKFSRHNLSGKDTRIGDGSHLIQMLILDFSSAQMILLKSNLSSDTTDSLEWYLRKYLIFLQSAGHHVRYDLPDFNDVKYRSHINYSLVTGALEREELCAGVTVHGIAEFKINEYLRDTWLDVISRAQGFCGERPTDMLSSCLTEIQSTWIGNLDHHFHIRFAPPRVRVLCAREVVLSFVVPNVHFYDSVDFEREPIRSYADWEFAFIVEVVEDRSTSAFNLKLDLSTARFCQQRSTTFAADVNIHFTYLINFLTHHYLELLVTYNMLCIYYPGGYHITDIETPDFSGISEDESDWRVEIDKPSRTSIIVWTEAIKQVTLHGFDHMIAISEASINALFASLRNTASKSGGCLAEWRYKDTFHAEFSNIRVKLLSGSKALVTFTVDDGHLTLADKLRKYTFSSWTISYEVDIKMVDQTELRCNENWLTDFSNLILGTREGNEAHSTTKHIILDFANAQYVYKHSSMPSMWNDGAIVAVDQLKSFIHFMRKYLVELTTNGHNIIHSTPIFPHTHHFGLTSVSFQIVSKNVVTVTNCMFEHEAPVVMVFGMMGGRPLLAETISWGHGWVIPGSRTLSHGTMCLSRAAFLEGRLLNALELVNRRTTVVPRFPGDNEKEWNVHLTTWNDHNYRKNERCNWKRVPTSNPGWLEYAWEHRDDWSYEHAGTHNQAFAYSVLCHTKNQLCIATAYNPRSLEIILRGESVLRLKHNDEGKSNWSKRSSARWNVKMHINTELGGLRVTIVDKVDPVFDMTEAEGQWDIDTHKLLEEHLPRIIDVQEVIRDLKDVFEGAWQYSCAGTKVYSLVSPVFKENGDLIVQLGGFTESSATTTVISGLGSPAKLNPPRLGGHLVPSGTSLGSLSLNGSIVANGPKVTPRNITDSVMAVNSVGTLLTPSVEAVGEALIVEKLEQSKLGPLVVELPSGPETAVF